MTTWTLRPALPGEADAPVDGDMAAIDGETAWTLVLVRDDGVQQGLVRVRWRIGERCARYWYHVGTSVRVAPELAMHQRDRVLTLCNDHTGAVELAGIALRDDGLDADTHAALARLLVSGALALVREHADPGEALRVIAALPGVRKGGRSTFWDGLGGRFYPGDPDASARRHGPLWQTHLAALLPQLPVVLSLLHPDARDALGAVPESCNTLRAALLQAGFRCGRYASIDDGGAVFETELDPQYVPASGLVSRRSALGAREIVWSS